MDKVSTRSQINEYQHANQVGVHENLKLGMDQSDVSKEIDPEKKEVP